PRPLAPPVPPPAAATPPASPAPASPAPANPAPANPAPASAAPANPAPANPPPANPPPANPAPLNLAPPPPPPPPPPSPAQRYGDLLHRAQRMFRRGQEGKAAALAQQALALNPRSDAAMVVLGECELDRGNSPEAARWADR